MACVKKKKIGEVSWCRLTKTRFRARREEKENPFGLQGMGGKRGGVCFFLGGGGGGSHTARRQVVLLSSRNGDKPQGEIGPDTVRQVHFPGNAAVPKGWNGGEQMAPSEKRRWPRRGG